MSKERAKPGEPVELTCPECGHELSLPVPGNACQQFYKDEGGCGQLIRGRGGRCVFCSYGSKECDTGC